MTLFQGFNMRSALKIAGLSTWYYLLRIVSLVVDLVVWVTTLMTVCTTFVYFVFVSAAVIGSPLPSASLASLESLEAAYQSIKAGFDGYGFLSSPVEVVCSGVLAWLAKTIFAITFNRQKPVVSK